jgi:hypothetical protein
MTNQPQPSVLNIVYETLDRRYKKNLKYLYVVRERGREGE